MELLALLGLLGFGVYYATSSKSSTSDTTVNPKAGPFSDVNCNVIFNGLPKEQKDVILQAIVAGNKDNIKVAANAARLLYPDDYKTREQAQECFKENYGHYPLPLGPAENNYWPEGYSHGSN